ncbi:hypothetical protein ANN_14299 [Periplaneta americana]|uniref:HTH psq-type domain-containing protein n=1 Tax=Periplaneta americana TaxID=6978 RepID=A0ABQ8SVY1_PERAM|nr:hypothetical protein ANN_14299 [Periplaneta americana]
MHIIEARSPVVQETLKMTRHSVETGRLSKMPSNINNTSRVWTEDQMQKAIKAFREGRSQHHAADLYAVLHSCLQRVCKAGASSERLDLHNNWLVGFRKRIREIALRNAEGLLLALSNRLNRKDVTEYSNLLKETAKALDLVNKPHVINIPMNLIATNEELWRRTNQSQICYQIKQRKLNWIRHTLRKPDGATEKTAIDWNPQGVRKRGRPRKTWKQSIEEEVERYGKSWKEVKWMAGDRVRWRNFTAALCSI